MFTDCIFVGVTLAVARCWVVGNYWAGYIVGRIVLLGGFGTRPYMYGWLRADTSVRPYIIRGPSD